MSACILVVVVMNMQYLQEIVKRTSRQQIPIDDKPLLLKKSNPLPPSFQTRQSPREKSTPKTNSAADVINHHEHRVAGLNCDRYGGPSEENAKEMIYWEDIAEDAEFISPFADYGPTPKYLTFEPDEGGWNSKYSVASSAALCLVSNEISPYLYRHSHVHGNSCSVGTRHGTDISVTTRTKNVLAMAWQKSRRESIHL